MIHLGDITKINGYDVPIVDCVVGGSPCQNFSVAGNQRGLEGDQSVLFVEQLRVIKEMRDRDARNGRSGEFIRPRFMVWENVPGAFSTNGGKDFQKVLEETAKVVDKDAIIPMPPKNKWTTSGCIMGDGWSIAWRVFDAQFWGVPQRRRRIALVADFGGGCAPEILFVRKSLRGNIEEGRTERKGTPTDAEGCFEVHDRDGEKCISLEPGIASREGGHIYENVSGTLRANAGDNQMSVACSIENHPSDGRMKIDESGKVQTLTSRIGSGGGNGPMVMESVVGIDAYNQQLTGDVALTLRSARGDNEHLPLVVMDRSAFNQGINYNLTETGDKVCTLTSGGYGSTGTCPKVIMEHKPHYIVRRLTPLECERLQGFPDGWTDIGEYTDSKGKKKKTSDTARYKALGNSIALPSWKWVIKRLCSHYERDVILASLFDGIGGFPLIWEQINGKGSAVWASEIEDFPMAVTKARIR